MFGHKKGPETFEDFLSEAIYLSAYTAWETAKFAAKGGYVIARTLWGRATTANQNGTVVVGFHQEAWLPTWPITIDLADRNKHVVIFGATGSGKSVQMKRIIVSDMQTMSALVVIDPKGDTAEELLPYLPNQRRRNTVFLDLTDTERPIGLNPLRQVPPHLRTRAVSDVVMTFRNLFRHSWGPRVEHFLRMGVATLLASPKPATLLELPLLFLDETYRESVISHTTNPGIRLFWEREFPAMAKRVFNKSKHGAGATGIGRKRLQKPRFSAN